MLPDTLSIWALRAGFPDLDDGTQHLLTDSAGEVCFIVARQPDDSITVFRRERAQEPIWLMTASDIEDVARFLCVELAPAVRSAEGMEPIALSFDDEVRDGWRIDQASDRLRVFGPSGQHVAEFALEDPFGVSRSADFTQYALLDWGDFFSLLTLDVRAAQSSSDADG